MKNNYIVYKTTNILNNKYYIGVHSQEGKDFDGYLGSGNVLKQSISKYGKENFLRETLYSFDNEKDAYSKEKELVTLDLVSDPNCYNLKIGGLGGNGSTTYKSNFFKKESRLKAEESRLKSTGSKYGKLHNEESRLKTKSTLLNKYGNICGQMHTEESRIKAKETFIKKYGSMTNHLHTKESVLKRRQSSLYNKLLKLKEEIPIIEDIIQVIDIKTNNVVWEDKFYLLNPKLEKWKTPFRNWRLVRRVYKELSSNKSQIRINRVPYKILVT